MSEDNLIHEEKEKVIIDKNEEVIVIPKTTFNYVIVAVTFLIVGIAVGYFGLDKGSDDISVTINEDQLREVLVNVLEDSELNFGGTGNNSDRFELVDDDPYLGDADAPIVIVEFSDFFCTFCKRHFDQTFVPLLENYGEHIRYVYRDFAQLTAESAPAAAAAQCAFEQGAFWDFHNEFFDNQNSLERDFYISTAETFGLDIDEYTACLDEGRYNEEVAIDQLDGTLEGVRGTPGFFINGQFISGAQPYPIFERLIQKELKQAGISFEIADAEIPAETTSESDAEATEESADDSNADSGT